MLGGRILGEGVDGCILEKPGWPCVNGSKGVPEPSDPRYVSKVVPREDTESIYLNLARDILGEEISDKYIAGLHGECKPADIRNPPNRYDHLAFRTVKQDIIKWNKTGMSCERLKDDLISGKDISKKNKIMFISKYKESVSDWINRIQEERIPFNKVMYNIERAVPMFLSILQGLFQGKSQLIHLDLHVGNIFIKDNPFEFGMADFGHCVFRQNSGNEARTFYGEFLINNVAKFTFYDGHFSQVPFEACLMNYCYRKNMELSDPYSFIQSWSSDSDVRQFSSSSSDTIFSSKDYLLNILLKRPLFLTMLSTIQSIVKKLKRNLSDHTKLFESLSPIEKITIEFILTRYHVISPFNAISEDIMNVYKSTVMTPLKVFVLKSVTAPYEQNTSLSTAFTSIQGADMAVLWSDSIRGLSN
jgi:hypothetical protein